MTFDEVPIYYFPYGGFMISYSREMAMNKDGTINKETRTIPHIVVEDTGTDEDLMNDKSIQAVIED